MRYLVFVFFLIVVIVFAHASHRGTSERLGERLMQAASGALQLDASGEPKDPRYRDVKFEVSHLDIILTGRVATKEMREELVHRIREGSAVGRVRYRDVMLLMAEEPELAVVMVPGKVTLEGRIPSEELKMRLKGAFQPMGLFVSAENLKVDESVNAEPWIEGADAMLGRFFQGAEEGEFVLRDGVLRMKRGMEKKMDIDFLKAELEQWLPAGRYQLEDEMVVAEPTRPVELSMRKVGGRWILGGLLPDQPALESIVRVIGESDAPAEVDGSGVKVDASLTRPRWLQDGRIERFLKVFVSTVQENPQVIIRGDGVQLMGTARNFIAKSNLPSFAGEAFGYGTPVNDEGVRVAESGPAESERWLRFDVNPAKVVITGAVATEQAKAELVASLARAYPAAEMQMEALLVDGSLAAMPWLGALGAYFVDLAALTTQGGTVDLSGKEAFLGGIARTEWNRDALVGKLEQTLGPEFLVYDQLLVDPRGENAPTGGAIKIFFGLGARQVGKDQQGKIDQAAQRIQRAGTGGSVLALVKGYASPGGSAEYNIKLSEDRAMAVYDALIGKGVNPKALKILNEGVDPSLTGEEARRVEIFIR